MRRTLAALITESPQLCFIFKHAAIMRRIPLFLHISMFRYFVSINSKRLYILQIIQGLIQVNLDISIPVLGTSNLDAQNNVCQQMIYYFSLQLEGEETLKYCCFYWPSFGKVQYCEQGPCTHPKMRFFYFRWEITFLTNLVQKSKLSV